jgi:hypothetical protein
MSKFCRYILKTGLLLQFILSVTPVTSSSAESVIRLISKNKKNQIPPQTDEELIQSATPPSSTPRKKIRILGDRADVVYKALPHEIPETAATSVQAPLETAIIIPEELPAATAAKTAPTAPPTELIPVVSESTTKSLPPLAQQASPVETQAKTVAVPYVVPKPQAETVASAAPASDIPKVLPVPQEQRSRAEVLYSAGTTTPKAPEAEPPPPEVKAPELPSPFYWGNLRATTSTKRR